MSKIKNFFLRWSDSIKNMTHEQQLSAKISGTGGNIFGLIFASIFLIKGGMWYFIFVMFFTLFLQVITFIGLIQQRKAYLELIENQQKMADTLTQEPEKIEEGGVSNV